MICVRVTTAPISTHTLRKEGDLDRHSMKRSLA